MDVTFQIGEPVVISPETIKVQINLVGDNVPVYQNLQTNDPFIVSLDPGDYVMNSKFNDTEGCDTKTCFTIPDTPTTCECPDLRDVAWAANSNGIYYLTGIATMPDGLPPCGLRVQWVASDNSNNSSITYTDATQFDSVSGDEYSFKVYLGGASGYSVDFISDCCHDRLLKCGSYSFTSNTNTGGTGRCAGNQIVGPIIPTLIRDGGDLIHIQLHIPAQTTPPPYVPFSVNYLELYGCDSGIFNITLPSTTPPYDYIIPTALNPCVPWTNPSGGLYHNTYAINIYSCDGTVLLGSGSPKAPAP